MYDIIIIGAGTAGLTAAVYGARAGKQVLVLEENVCGGQIVNTPEVENYPGIRKISGHEFARALYEQAAGLGVCLVYEKALEIKEQGRRKLVCTQQQEYAGKAVILAGGARPRPLGLEREEELKGAGVSYCAICDGAFFKGKNVAVAGGGDTALEEALFLSELCTQVCVIHRREQLRGAVWLQKRLQEKKNISFLLECRVTQLLGTSRLEALDVQNIKNGQTKRIQVSGLFIAVGQMPENQAFASVADLDAGGYICAGEDCRTRTPGIFAAGDCRTKQIRQLTTAASDGAVAALAACAYLGEMG